MTLEIRDAEISNIAMDSVSVTKALLILDTAMSSIVAKRICLKAMHTAIERSTIADLTAAYVDLDVACNTCTMRNTTLESGVLRGAFINCTFDNVDMRNVRMEDVSFFHMDRIQQPDEMPLLPDKPDNFLCASWTMLDVLDELEPRMGQGTRKWIDVMRVYRKNARNARYKVIDPSIFLGQADTGDIPVVMEALFANRARQSS
jgi:hypothetical protein